ncbi:ABC transporter substrate-binding protein [Pseudonocardia kunmingensis]|uniref:Carbohydrate ABC transporter substrate-binding protein (CUT1 family) n=1 Tax=Pseudonocardia kunmingensis TaxID=630975 RepID=A0A543DYQ7_9PSEU|nr:ABC transporter substrate-binding protein [Pseudonocardia kunmingensis]TQM14454.1 carbohydrate ABC transporter substrate-binding protein (CUT1 family) [Pseudonocardia kunmingensis]
MNPSPLSRRRFLLGAASLTSVPLLTSCVGSGSGGGGGGEVSSTITLQSSVQDAGPKAALEQLVAAYAGVGAPVTMNSVATEQFRAQLSTYLSSATPPDVLTWYAGSVANSYAAEGLLLDVSDLWTGDGACAGFSDALRSLSTSADGQAIFVPTSYYWWSIFYKRSAFEKWGIEPPTTWDGFIALCDELKGRGVHPLTNGIGTTPWMASGWFDYLNLRINGAQYHRALLAGERSFTDPEVAAVMEQYARLIPYFHPNQTSWDSQQAVTPMVNDEAAMYLVGAFAMQYFPADQRDDLDFFSVPTIDPSVPSAEEAPTDGYFAAAASDNPDGAKALMSYLASPEVQAQYIAKLAEAGSGSLPTSPDVDTSGFAPVVQKGIELLNSTQELTQFFNRDSSDALQTTADAALTRFLADPTDVPGQLQAWQTAAQQVFSS